MAVSAEWTRIVQIRWKSFALQPAGCVSIALVGAYRYERALLRVTERTT
jgi:hypothetical protein